MDLPFYTHALWRVNPGQEEQFIAAWQEMAEVFLRLAGESGGETKGTLIQSLDNPTRFYSFGPWASLEAVGKMRADPEAQAALSRVRALCEEATPGVYRVVATMGR